MTRRYAGLAAVGGAAAAYILLARPRHLRWGTMDQESDEPLPGDDLIQSPNLETSGAQPSLVNRKWSDVMNECDR
jgi:hypothetical protein